LTTAAGGRNFLPAIANRSPRAPKAMMILNPEQYHFEGFYLSEWWDE